MESRKVFISYSRYDLRVVNEIKSVIESAIGEECWLDLSDIGSDSEEFSEEIIQGIRDCHVFLFMLSPKSQESKFALKELRFARRKKKHVVLLEIEDCLLNDLFDFNFSGSDIIKWNDLPQQKKILRDINRWVKPLSVIKDKEEENNGVPKEKDAFLKIKSDMDCLFYLDGEKVTELKAGTLMKVPLRIGEYELKFVSIENSLDTVEEDYTMSRYDKRYDVKLLSIREERIKRECLKQKKQIKTQLEHEKSEHIKEEQNNIDGVRKKGKQEVLPDQIITVNGLSFIMKYVEGGTFFMGAQKTNPDRPNYDEEAEEDEGPVHGVTVSSFYIGETVVTQVLWKAVMGKTTSFFKGDNLPVEQVSWHDIQEFVKKLNKLTNKNFRLPTEAEWEFAARGGKYGNGYRYSGSNLIEEVAWSNNNSCGTTHPVKTKAPNELGLFDMSGNVWEWCGDWFGGYNSASQVNPMGPKKGPGRVLRGGSWFLSARRCRVSYRLSNDPESRGNRDGFRLVLPIYTTSKN